MKKIWIVTWKGEGERDFGILGTPSELESEVYESVAYDIISGARELEEGTEAFEEAVLELQESLTGESEIDGRDYGYECDYNVESFELEV